MKSIVVFLVVVFLLTVAWAQDGDGKGKGGKDGPGGKGDRPLRPGQHGGRKPPKARSISFKIDDHSLMIDARHMTPEQGKSRIQFAFTTQGLPRFRARYFTHDKDADTKDFFKFRIGLARILEFNDTNDDGFDKDDRKNVVQAFKFDGLPKDAWTKLPSKPEAVTNDDGAKAFQLSTSVQQQAPGTATVTLTLGFSEQEAYDAVRNRTLQPNGLKFDVDIENWTYKSAGTKLALLFRIEAKDKTVPNADVDATSDIGSDDAIGVGDSQAGHFGWVQTVTTQILDQPGFQSAAITPSKLWQEDAEDALGDADTKDDDFADELHSLVAFTVKTEDGSQPTSVHWDPTTLVNDDKLDAENSAASSWSVMVSALVVLAAILL